MPEYLRDYFQGHAGAVHHAPAGSPKIVVRYSFDASSLSYGRNDVIDHGLTIGFELPAPFVHQQTVWHLHALVLGFRSGYYAFSVCQIFLQHFFSILMPIDCAILSPVSSLTMDKDRVHTSFRKTLHGQPSHLAFTHPQVKLAMHQQLLCRFNDAFAYGTSLFVLQSSRPSCLVLDESQSQPSYLCVPCPAAE